MSARALDVLALVATLVVLPATVIYGDRALVLAVAALCCAGWNLRSMHARRRGGQ